MPTKTKTKGKGRKGRKNKKSKEEVDKDKMWEECVSLQEEVCKVQKQTEHFMMEVDKAQRFWEYSKRNLDEAKARMREKLRLKQDVEQHHREEIVELEQKIKQLEAAHYNEICELKVATVTAASQTQREHVETKTELQKKMHTLLADEREREFLTETFIRKMKQKQHDELKELIESYEKQVRGIEAKYNKRIEVMALENYQRTETELSEVDWQCRIKNTSVSAKHDEAWSDLDKYKHQHWEEEKLEKIEKLEGRIEAADKNDKRLERRMAAAMQEKEHLKESLQEMKSKLCESSQQLVKERKAMAESLKRGKERSACILEERRDLYLMHNQLELKHEQVQQECDELQERQTEAVLDMQQKSDQEALMLERKIKAMTEIQEKEQLKLWVVLTFGQGSSMAAKNITELFMSKDATVEALKDIMSQDLKEYDNLAEKAAALGVSVNQQLPLGAIKKSIGNTSEDNVPLACKNFDNLMQELTALCISEDDSVQKEDLGLNPVSTSPDGELLQL